MINFKNFTALNNNEKEMIFKWRNDGRVNEFFIKKNITKKEHFNFIKSLENNKTKLYFLLLLNGENNDKMSICGISQELISRTLQGLKEKPIGVINFIDINKNECEFGIYQNPNLKGFGGVLLNELTRYAFEILSVQRLNARAFNKNLKAIKLFANFGFSVINKDLNFTYFQMNNEYYLNKWGGDLVFIYILFVKYAFLAIFINKVSKNLYNFELLILTSFLTSNLRNFTSFLILNILIINLNLQFLAYLIWNFVKNLRKTLGKGRFINLKQKIYSKRLKQGVCSG